MTDVVVLPGGEADRRMSRIATLGLRVHDGGWLLAPAPAAARELSDTVAVLVRGAVLDLSDTGTPWTVAATWRQQAVCDVDVVAFAVDAQDRSREMRTSSSTARPSTRTAPYA
ncbi:hypothetical protein [Streptomyces sp. NPDC020951]|uniref:hypothetical protein n=1 Tax=Streptomyces sp. NPDC020951 TaxID=3365104 RepID=UPI0037B350F9